MSGYNVTYSTYDLYLPTCVVVVHMSRKQPIYVHEQKAQGTEWVRSVDQRHAEWIVHDL